MTRRRWFSVHGADCMNLMFLPPRGVIVEIDPVHYGAHARRQQTSTFFTNPGSVSLTMSPSKMLSWMLCGCMVKETIY